MTQQISFIEKVAVRTFLPLCYLLALLPRRRASWNKDLDWHVHREGGDLMRRRVSGEWQYRAMNEEEYRRYFADRR